MDLTCWWPEHSEHQEAVRVLLHVSNEEHGVSPSPQLVLELVANGVLPSVRPANVAPEGDHIFGSRHPLYILGRSGRDMLDALVAGSSDPELLAELARGKPRSKIPQLQAALTGRFGPNHALVVGEILAHLDYIDESLGRLQAGIDAVVALSLRPGIGS